MKLCFWDVPQVSLRTLDGKKWIVLSPHDQRPGLPVSKEIMPPVILRKIRLIIVKQIQLNRIIARAIKKILIHGVGVRTDSRNILRPMRVLKLGGFFLE